MLKLTDEQMIHIIKNKLISTQTEAVKKQVFEFAYGAEYMASNDKGDIKIYNDGECT
tara:strand:- start:4860 stop:5030 length:171 start_codon:yes stop_codon:yes gene_type:complete